MKKQMNKIKYTDLHIRFLGTQSSTGSYQHGYKNTRQARKSALTGTKSNKRKKLWKTHSFGYNAMRKIKYHIGYDVISFNQKAFLPCWIQWLGCRPYNVHSDNRNNFQSVNRICPIEVLKTVQIVHLFFLRFLQSYRSSPRRLQR